MALFLSTYTNRVDKKGRVSVPAPFRQAVAPTQFQGLILLPSSKQPCIDGLDMDRMQALSESLDQMDFLSDDRDALAHALFADSHMIAFDGDGRISLPRDLMEAAGITDEAAFVGIGRTFQIWDPATLATYKKDYRQRAQKLSGVALAGGGSGPTGGKAGGGA